MNNKVLETVYETLRTVPPRPRKDYWLDPFDQKPRTLVQVLCEWVPQLKDEVLASLPHLDDPADGLYKRLEGGRDPDPKSHIIVNSFQLLEDCLTTTLVCYKRNEYKPTLEEMFILVRLAARALEFRESLDETRWRMRHKICSFFTNHVFSAEGSHFPQDLVRHAFHQFTLYWWAIPQQYKNELFSLERGVAVGLKGDFLLHAAEIVKDIFFIGQQTVLRADRVPPKRSVTSYHSVKGGTGKSTLALAHAVALSKNCKGREKVAILALDMLNPSFLAMRVFAHAPEDFRFLDLILASNKIEPDDLENAFLQSTKNLPILFGSCFGPSSGRDPLLSMLGPHRETWQKFVDNLRAVIQYLFDKKDCNHIILDNSSGFFAASIPSAVVTAEHEGTLVLVSTLDAFDAGTVPVAQAAYDGLFSNRKRVIVFNKCPDSKTREAYENDRELIIAQAWSEALSRAGLEPLVDASAKRMKSGIYGDISKEKWLFVNTHKMLTERGDWDIEFVDYLRELTSLWALTPSGASIVSLEDFVTKIQDIPRLMELSNSIISGDTKSYGD